MKPNNKPAFLISLLLLFLKPGAVSAGEGEPLSVTVVAGSHWGTKTFTRGSPVSISIFIYNNLVSQHKEEAAATERTTRQEAERKGYPVPHGETAPADAKDSRIRIADNAPGVFSAISLTLARTGSAGDEFLQIDWKDMVSVTSFNPPGDPVLVGESPVWITFEMPPEISSALLPGSYLMSVSFPGAEPGSLAFRVQDAGNEAEHAMMDYELAEYFLRLKDYPKAVAHARKALHKLTVGHDMLYLTLGDAYVGLKKPEKAIEAYEHFLKTYGNARGWAYPSIVRQTVNDLKQEINAGKEK